MSTLAPDVKEVAVIAIASAIALIAVILGLIALAVIVFEPGKTNEVSSGDDETLGKVRGESVDATQGSQQRTSVKPPERNQTSNAPRISLWNEGSGTSSLRGRQRTSVRPPKRNQTSNAPGISLWNEGSGTSSLRSQQMNSTNPPEKDQAPSTTAFSIRKADDGISSLRGRQRTSVRPPKRNQTSNAPGISLWNEGSGTSSLRSQQMNSTNPPGMGRSVQLRSVAMCGYGKILSKEEMLEEFKECCKGILLGVKKAVERGYLNPLFLSDHSSELLRLDTTRGVYISFGCRNICTFVVGAIGMESSLYLGKEFGSHLGQNRISRKRFESMGIENFSKGMLFLMINSMKVEMNDACTRAHADQHIGVLYGYFEETMNVICNGLSKSLWQQELAQGSTVHEPPDNLKEEIRKLVDVEIEKLDMKIDNLAREIGGARER